MEAYIGEPLLYPPHMLEGVARQHRETAFRIKFQLMLARSRRADESERRDPIEVFFL
jgi:hypothetical protein